jgi:hypothetical protein
LKKNAKRVFLSLYFIIALFVDGCFCTIKSSLELGLN